MDDYLTIDQVAELLKVSTKTVRRLLQKAEIPGFQVGQQWRFKRAQIEVWADAQVQGAVREVANGET